MWPQGYDVFAVLVRIGVWVLHCSLELLSMRQSIKALLQ